MAMRVVVGVFLALVAVGAPLAESVRGRGGQLPGDTLDQLVAPIALYPDQLLAQILLSAAEPAKVVELDKWLKANPQLKGTQLQDAAVKAGFEPSFVALALFPHVVTKMADQIALTALLGEAFTSDRSAVFAAIQRLRQQAKTVGTLKSTPQQSVETTKTSAGQEVIVIQPTNPQVVHVPQYNTQVVYTQAPTTTTVIVEQDDDADVAVAAGLIGFTAGVAIGAAMDNNYYYGPYGWRGGAYMYNDAWDDYYDAREDARDDWMDHREDLVEERGDVAQNREEQRTERLETTQQQRTQRAETAQGQRAERQSTEGASQSRSDRAGSAQARGYSGSERTAQRSSGSDAFSGYSSGRSQRSASERGQRSRSSSRSGGGRRR